MSVIALALVAALQTAPAPSAEVEVGAVIDQLHREASAADGAAYFGLFAPDARFIGTDATERWSVEAFRAYAMPYFRQGKGWTYMPHDRVVTVADIDCRCVAWFDEALTNDAYGVVRGSGVLRKTNAGWKIEQYVLSYAVPNDVARAVTGLIREHEAGVKTAVQAEPAAN